jgi:hypothetical protein
MKLLDMTAIRLLQLGSVAMMTSALVACGGGSSSGSPPTGTIDGTAAIGAALANATVQMTCKNGSGSATTNSSGAYSATFAFDGPCFLTATSGSIVMNSMASGAGSYNVTPLTTLLLSYIAAQLGTTVSGLESGIQSNTSFQSALSSSTVVGNAETAVATLLQTSYGVTLSTSSLLTTSFVPGQPGLDADLDALQTAGEIDSTGTPASSLTTAAAAAGASAPITTSGSGPTGGTGASSGS